MSAIKILTIFVFGLVAASPAAHALNCTANQFDISGKSTPISMQLSDSGGKFIPISEQANAAGSIGESSDSRYRVVANIINNRLGFEIDDSLNNTQIHTWGGFDADGKASVQFDNIGLGLDKPNHLISNSIVIECNK